MFYCIVMLVFSLKDEKIAVEYLLDQTDPLSGTVSFDLTQEQQEDILPEDNMVIGS